jgi:N-methylhydantoinase B
MEERIDPFTAEVIKSALDSTADQMAIVLMRSAYSAIVRDSVDYSTAVFDADGRMLAQGLTTPLHLGSFPDAIQHIIKKYSTNMEPGDVFALNDPYGSGGMHLPDIYAIKPVFYQGQVEGYAGTIAHHTDVGGISPGSNSIHSTEIYQEGLRLPALKLYEHNQPNETLFAIIEKNVRVPNKVLGDIRAQLAACNSGEQALLELLDRYGVATFRRYTEEILNHAERIMRAQIRMMPDGVYEFTDFIDGLGENPEPITFHVTITVAGDSITVDWTGTSPQVKGGINAPVPFTRSATYLALRCIAGPGIPNSEGYMRPIRVIAPPGTIVNPLLPGPCAARGITGYRMMDTVLGAMAAALPERVPAAGEGGASLPSIGGYHQGRPFVYVETILGVWGGRPTKDGTEGISNPAANQSNQPVELIEAEYPLQVVRYGLVKDSAGAGKFRGGLGLVREYRLLADEAVFTMRSDRRVHRPYGLRGGRPGAPSWNLLNPGPCERVLPVLPLEAVVLKKGDVFRHVMAGGGGYGDPLERDPQLVMEDVLDDKISPEYAVREHGVVVDPRRTVVDWDATRAERASVKNSAAADEVDARA